MLKYQQYIFDKILSFSALRNDMTSVGPDQGTNCLQTTKVATSKKRANYQSDHICCIRVVEALGRLHRCTGWPEHSLFAYVIRAKIAFAILNLNIGLIQ